MKQDQLTPSIEAVLPSTAADGAATEEGPTDLNRQEKLRLKEVKPLLAKLARRVAAERGYGDPDELLQQALLLAWRKVRVFDPARQIPFYAFISFGAQMAMIRVCGTESARKGREGTIGPIFRRKKVVDRGAEAKRRAEQKALANCRRLHSDAIEACRAKEAIVRRELGESRSDKAPPDPEPPSLIGGQAHGSSVRRSDRGSFEWALATVMGRFVAEPSGAEDRLAIEEALALAWPTLEAALEKLKPSWRKVIQLVFFEGLSLADAAATLNLTYAAAYSQQRQAIERLRDLLAESRVLKGRRE